MSEMREWWANVYRDAGEVVVGLEWETRRRCVDEIASDAAFRIHVRLKPEGAPKRYASEMERLTYEHIAQYPKAFGYLALSEASPRTLKIEESA